MPSKEQLIAGAIGLILPFIIAASTPQAHCEYQILDNTDNCLGNCHTIFRMRCDRALTPKGIFQFNATIDLTKGANNFTSKGIDVLRERFKIVDVPVYGNCTGNHTSNITNATVFFNYSCVVNYTTKKEDYEEWDAVDPDSDIFLPNKWYYFKLWGKRPPKLGENNAEVSFYVGNILVFDPPWLSGWTYSKNITVNNTEAAQHDLEFIKINATGLKLSTDNCTKELVLTNATGTEINLDITNDGGQALASGSQWCEIAFLSNCSASSECNYSLYYGNASADETEEEIQLYYSDFEDEDVDATPEGWTEVNNITHVNDTEVPAWGGSHSLASSGGNNEYDYVSFTAQSKNFTVQYSFYTEYTGVNYDYVGIPLTGGDTFNGEFMRYGVNDDWEYYDTSAYAKIDDYPNNEWHNCTIVYYGSPSSKRFYKNKTDIGAKTGIIGTAASLSAFEPFQNTLDFFLDNILVTRGVIYQANPSTVTLGNEETEVVDTCTPPASGDWNVNCSDECVKTTTRIVVVGCINLYGTGNLTFSGINVTANNLSILSDNCDLILIPTANLIIQ